MYLVVSRREETERARSVTGLRSRRVLLGWLLLALLLVAVFVQATYCVGDMMIIVGDGYLRPMSAAIATGMIAGPGGGLKKVSVQVRQQCTSTPQHWKRGGLNAATDCKS